MPKPCWRLRQKTLAQPNVKPRIQSIQHHAHPSTRRREDGVIRYIPGGRHIFWIKWRAWIIITRDRNVFRRELIAKLNATKRIDWIDSSVIIIEILLWRRKANFKWRFNVRLRIKYKLAKFQNRRSFRWKWK